MKEQKQIGLLVSEGAQENREKLGKDSQFQAEIQATVRQGGFQGCYLTALSAAK